MISGRWVDQVAQHTNARTHTHAHTHTHTHTRTHTHTYAPLYKRKRATTAAPPARKDPPIIRHTACTACARCTWRGHARVPSREYTHDKGAERTHVHHGVDVWRCIHDPGRVASWAGETRVGWAEGAQGAPSLPHPVTSHAIHGPVDVNLIQVMAIGVAWLPSCATCR
jgi:hypothetical protein